MPPTLPPFDPSWRPRARADVDFRQVGEDWVLFDPVAQRVHVLDVTSALVWSYCTGEMDVAAMESEIRRAFGAALPKRKDTGVGKALAMFAEGGLLAARGRDAAARAQGSRETRSRNDDES